MVQKKFLHSGSEGKVGTKAKCNKSETGTDKSNKS